MFRWINKLLPKSPESPHDRLLNWRLLIGTVVVVAVVAPSLYFYHRHQVRRNASALLERASELEAAQEWQSAADYVMRYLVLEPDDAQARIQLARTYSQFAGTPAQRRRAIEHYYAAAGLSRGDDQLECHRALMPLLLELDRHEEAVQQAELVLAAAPDDLAAQRVKALALFTGYRQGSLAAEHLDRASLFSQVHNAWERQQHDLELAGAMAITFREQPELLPKAYSSEAEARAAEADKVMDLLIAAAPANPRAYVSRHLYRLQYKLPGAEEDIVKATELGASDSAVQTLAARYWMTQARRLMERPDSAQTESQSDAMVDRASAIYRHMLENLDDVQELAYVELGDALALKGESAQALENWERGLTALKGESLALHLRLAEALTDMNSVERAIRQVQAVEAAFQRSPAAEGADKESTRWLVQLLRAQVMIAQGDLSGAERIVEKVSVGGQLSDSVMNRAQRVWFAIGEARGRIGDWDHAAAAFEEATRLQPGRTGSQFGAAVAWRQANRFDLAIPYYQQVARQVDSFDLWLGLAEARFEQILAHPEFEQDWQSVRDALVKVRALADAAPADRPVPVWRAKLLEAKLLLAADDDPKLTATDRLRSATELLASLEADGASDADCLNELALTYARWGQQAAADNVAAKLEDVVSGDYRSVVLQVNLAAAKGDVAAAKASLDKHLATEQDAKSKVELLRALTGVCLLDNDFESARAALASLHELEPWNLRTTVQLAELLIQLSDFSALEKLLPSFDNSGSGGRTAGLYCQCLSLMTQSKGIHDAKFATARTIQQTLERERPAWSVTYSLKGRLDEMQGLAEQAAESYRKAISLGEQRAWVLERQVMLLNQFGRFEEAESILKRVQGRGKLLSPLLVPPAGARDVAPLLAMAQRAVERNPRDPQPRVWLGHLLLRQAQIASTPDASALAEARTKFEEALVLAPRDASAWNGLFNYCVQARRTEEARAVLIEFVDTCAFEPAQRAFVLGQGYEVLGALAIAAEQYEEAANLAPANRLARLRLAGVYWNSDPAKAEGVLRAMLQEDVKALDVRRALAGLLFSRDGAKSVDEALALMDTDIPVSRMASEDLRLRARLLLQKTARVTESRREARLLLETLVSRESEATADDLFLLGQVCLGLLDFDIAQRQFIASAAVRDCTADQLAACAEQLLLLQDVDAVERILSDLAELESGTPRSVGLRARWLKASGDTEEARAELLAWSEAAWQEDQGAKRSGELCAVIGRAFESIHLFRDAEVWRRRQLEYDRADYPSLALNLAQQGGDNAKEAVGLCLAAEGNGGSPQQARTLASVVVASRNAVQVTPAIAQVFQSALSAHPQDVDLLVALANVDVVRGDSAAAVAKYERLRQLRPHDAEVMNNLASLLADVPERHAEALALVQAARDRAGDNLELLDTESQILLSQGNVEGAINRLEQAASASPRDPRLQIHLAASYHRAARTDRARLAYGRIDPSALDREFLTKRDRDLFDYLSRELGPAPR